MKNYKVLARKYRPNTLNDLVGHQHIIETFKNSINSEKIHHALLLTGTRGVGKTTIARIIALNLNCTGKDGSNKKPTINPCLECDNCKQIIKSTHPDVIEFDAASNTGVDSVREIIDNCIYPPISARYKIYIIDEVHMLSKAAFNAFLKTIEEPHDNVKFIFATTELDKVPVTVMSRCQKFVLPHLTDATIKENLSNICKKENVKIDDESLDLLTLNANGSVRDSLSLLDLLIISTGQDIDIDKTKEILSTPDEGKIIEFMDAIFKKDKILCMSRSDTLSTLGTSTEHIIAYMSFVFLELVKIISMEGYKADKDIVRLYEENKENIDIPKLMKCWQITSNSMSEVKYFRINILLQMMAIKIIHLTNLPTSKELLNMISDSR